MIEVGSSLRPGIGPKTRAWLASLELKGLWGNCINVFFGSSCEGEL